MNIVIVHPQQRTGLYQRNPYTMDVDRSNRNCYSCGGFGHLARNYRNRRIGDRIGEGRRLEYWNRLAIEGSNEQDFVERDLIALN